MNFTLEQVENVAENCLWLGWGLGTAMVVLIQWLMMQWLIETLEHKEESKKP